MANKDYYATLGVNKSARDDENKSAKKFDNCNFFIYDNVYVLFF